MPLMQQVQNWFLLSTISKFLNILLDTRSFSIAFTCNERCSTSFIQSYKTGTFDIRMPVMNGFELFKKIKSIDNDVEACFITAYEDYREEFRESFPMLDGTKYLFGNQKQLRI